MYLIADALAHSSPLYIALFFVVLIIIITVVAHRRKWPNVKGPFPLPFLGNALSMVKQSHHQLSRWHNEHNSDVIKFSIGLGPCLSVRDPELIAKLFGSRKYNKILVDNFAPVLGESLGVTNDFENWKKRQAANRHAFGQMDIMQQIARICKKELDIFKSKINKSAAIAQPFDLHTNMEKMTVDIMGKVALGADINCQTSDDKNVFASLTYVVSQLYLRIIAPVPYWKLLSTKKFDDAVDLIHGFIADLVQERKKKNDTVGAGSASETDLFSYFNSPANELTDAELREEMIGCIWPGAHHAAPLAFWVDLLANYPEVQTKLRAELQQVMNGTKNTPGVEEIEQMKYLDLVMKECARLYPLYPILARTPVEHEMVTFSKNKDQKEKEVLEIAPGDKLFVCPYVVHRNPNYWSKPEEFIPERFLPGGDGFGNKAYMAFGVGYRPCVAKNFMEIEAKIILATLVLNYKITPVPGYVNEDDIAITLAPMREVKVYFEKL